MTGMRTTMRGFRLVTVATVVAGMLFLAGSAVEAAQSENNLLSNSDLRSDSSGAPAAWKVEALPDCGFKSIVHDSNGAGGELEIINDEPAESAVKQSLRLKPGWYHFTAEIKVEALGSAGAPPELFARLEVPPVSIREHPLGWNAGWRTFHLFFKTGPQERDVTIGCALGGWGSPNTGRMRFRNPTLVWIEKPPTSKMNSSLDKDDLEAMATKRFGGPDAQQAFLPPAYPLGRRWTVGAVYAGFLTVAIFGWCVVSPWRAKRPMP